MSDDISRIDEELRKLQAQRDEAIAKARRAEERKAREASKILVGSTPKKKEKAEDAPLPERTRQPMFSSAAQLLARSKPPKQELPSMPMNAAAGPSRMGGKLAALRGSSSDGRSPTPPNRRFGSSTPRPGMAGGTGAKPLRSTDVSTRRKVEGRTAGANGEEKNADFDPADMSTVKRDEDSLIVIEDLQPGPKNFGRDPDGEFGWESLEPNSGLRLSKRSMAHSTVQDQLYGRYHLSPSQLYSVIRLSRDGATYDIPVDGEWVTIAVVAERGEVRMSGYKDASDSESDGEGSGTSKHKPVTGQAGAGHAKPGAPSKRAQPPKKRRAKKYINIRLAALPSRAVSGPGSGAGGDAMLQLLLFEADHVVRSEPDEQGKVKQTYKGGSGGAYERWCNLNPGDVIGLVNPKVLRPLKSGSNSPHPLTLPLALNPYSAESIFLIGQCRDLGRCNATQKDGNRCSTWVDTRKGPVCEYHVHLSIQRQKAGRAEFTASTSSFALQSRQSRSSGYGGRTGINHQTKTGLLPAAGPQAAPRGADNGGGGVTYVVGGGVIRSGGGRDGGLKGWGDEHLSEKLGRNRAEKRKKRMSERDAEEALNKLVGRKEGVGGQYLAAAARHREKQDEANGLSARKAKRKSQVEEEEEEEMTNKAFSVESIKKIGFDPTNSSSTPRFSGSEEKKRKADAVASLKTMRREFDPDAKVKRVNVRAPPQQQAEAGVKDKSVPLRENVDDMVDLD